MNFDQRVGAERSQFATQAAVIEEDLLKLIAKNFNGKESLEFYEGLLAGYACCYSIISGTSEADHKTIIGGAVSYIADVLEERS